MHRIKYGLIYLGAAFGYKRPVFNLSRRAATRAGKPLLNAGCGTSFTEASDVNFDIVPQKVCRFVSGDIQELGRFTDKHFGAVYASHVLEHVEDVDGALKEFQRVADNVYVITPFPLWPSAWLYPGHRWIIWRRRVISPAPVCYLRKVFRDVKRRIGLMKITSSRKRRRLPTADYQASGGS